MNGSNYKRELISRVLHRVYTLGVRYKAYDEWTPENAAELDIIELCNVLSDFDDEDKERLEEALREKDWQLEELASELRSCEDEFERYKEDTWNDYREGT